MKNYNFFVIVCTVLLIPILLCSCRERNPEIVNIDNITWKNDIFNLTATSEELQNQYYRGDDHDAMTEENFFSTFEFCGNLFKCFVAFGDDGRNYFGIFPISDDDLQFAIITETASYEFLEGKYAKLIEEKNMPYKYSLQINLRETGQYYDYCMANGLEFPETITLYGYEDK